MAKTKPGLYNRFRGLWVRGPRDNTPPDHFSDSQNNAYDVAGVRSRDKSALYLDRANSLRTLLYKPNPPFTGTNVPRMIILRSDGNLFDENFLGTPLYGNIDMTDFALVNFFGRCYISPSDGRVGIDNEFVYVYDGTGPSGFRKAAGSQPATPLTAALHLPLGSGTLAVGTYLISYALETASGFITQAATPFVAIDAFGASSIDITNLPLGPAGTTARWIIATKAIPLRADLSIPFDVSTANFYDQFLAVRVGDNTTIAYSLSFYDENLTEDANYLQTLLGEIPAGVGVMDYKGRMILYGEHDNPAIVRGSTIGEPESFSATSGFFITDPSDSTGVRSATEFRNILYVYKQQRGYVTQDNGENLSTWDVVNFEKSIGTEQYGIASILDAKGSSTEGFIIASRGAMVYFNGTVADPELSYKIRDLWKRINPTYFYKMQVASDPINKRIYALVPLNDLDENGNVTVARTTCSHIIVGDYRDGLDPMNIKWDLWKFTNPPISALIYNEFSNNEPNLVTRFANNVNIVTLGIGIQGNDLTDPIDSFFTLAPLRFTNGVSQFSDMKIRATGPCRLSMVAYGLDDVLNFPLADLSVPTYNPGREYSSLMNLVSEQCNFKVRNNILNEFYKINMIQLNGKALWAERPR